MNDSEVKQFPVNELEKLVGNTVKIYDGIFLLTGILSQVTGENDFFMVANPAHDATAFFRIKQVTEIWQIDPTLGWKISLI